VHPGQVPDVLPRSHSDGAVATHSVDGRDLALEVTLFEREIGAVGELEVVPGDLVARIVVRLKARSLL